MLAELTAGLYVLSLTTTFHAQAGDAAAGGLSRVQRLDLNGSALAVLLAGASQLTIMRDLGFRQNRLCSVSPH